MQEAERLDKIENDLYGSQPGCFLFEMLELKFKMKYLNKMMIYLNTITTLILLSLLGNLLL